MKNDKNRDLIIPPDVLLNGYAQGMFPMSESRHDSTVNWYSAKKRGIIPMDQFHVPKNVRRIIRQKTFTCRLNTRFRETIEACAERDTTWISSIIINSYEVLHQHGFAHSVEMYNRHSGKLAGGLYGVSLGAAFFGESMFRRENEADKAALWHCHNILARNGFELWDTQFYTKHLSRFGCVEITPQEYLEKLKPAIRKEAVFK